MFLAPVGGHFNFAPGPQALPPLQPRFAGELVRRLTSLPGAVKMSSSNRQKRGGMLVFAALRGPVVVHR